MLKQKINLRMTNQDAAPIVHLVQNDTGREIECNILDFDIPAGATSKLWLIKPSRKVASCNGTISGNVVTVALTDQVVAEDGMCVAQLKITKDGKTLSSFAMYFNFEEDASTNGIISQEEIKLVETFIAEQKKKLDAYIAGKTKDIEKLKTDVGTLSNDLTTLRNEHNTDIESMEQNSAPPITLSATGESIVVENSAEKRIRDLKIFGKSEQNGVPSPDSPAQIVSVGDKGNIEVEITGRNLCRGYKKGAYLGTNGLYITASDYYCTELIAVKDNKKYIESNKYNQTISDTHFFDNDKNWLGKVSENSINNRKPNTAYIAFDYYKAKEMDWVQVEEGLVATPYEPHKEPQSITLSTPNGLPGIKVVSGGNYTDSTGQQWITDEIDLARGKYIQRIEKYTSTGTEELNQISDNRFSITLRSIKLKECIDRYGEVNSVCDYLNSASLSEISTRTDSLNVNGVNVYIKLTETSTKDDVTTILAKGITFYYILNNFVERDLTPEEIQAYKELHTNYPTTIISNDENAGMEASYIADTKNYIDKKFEELNKTIVNTQIALL